MDPITLLVIIVILLLLLLGYGGGSMNAFPRYLSDDESNRRFRHAKSRGENVVTRFFRRVQTTNLTDRIGIQLGLMMILALTLTAFLNHVLRVFGIGAEPEMIGINAQSVISGRTVVADSFIGGNRAVMNLPRHTMRPDRASANLDFPVAVTTGRALPKPAFIGFDDAGKEVRDLFRGILIGHRTRPPVTRSGC